MSMSWFVRVFVLCLLQAQCGTALSQNPTLSNAPLEKPAVLPRYTIISVRETKGVVFQQSQMPDGFVATGITLNQLIMTAYKIPQWNRLDGGPSWKFDKRFDVQAKLDDSDVGRLSKFSRQERDEMLKQILEERFKLSIHEEKRVEPIYVLTVSSKLGPKIELSPTSGTDGKSRIQYPIVHSTKGQLVGEQFTMSSLANQLSTIMHRFVADETNLQGRYDFKLSWEPDDEQPKAEGSLETSPVGRYTTNSHIFSALSEQLGLQLKAAKGPVEYWVIDHVELPSEN